MVLPKIPDEILDKLRCQCGRYLSSLPVSVGQDGRSICSDCTGAQSSSIWTVVENFAYEAVASLFQFPCRYKPEGCSKYFPFHEIVEHEEECGFRTYQCPVNLLSACNTVDTASKLCQHYEKDHSELYLKTPNFRISINTDFEIYRLMKLSNMVFLLQTKCAVKQEKLWFSAVYFGSAKNAGTIKYSIKLSCDGNRKRVMELEEKEPLTDSCIQMMPSNCIEVDVPVVAAFLKSPEFVECFWKIIIPEQLTGNKQNEQKCVVPPLGNDHKSYADTAMKCSQCKISMTSVIYRCSNGHIICIDCQHNTSSSRNKCKLCIKHGHTGNLAQAIDLEEKAKQQQHQCRWNNCNDTFSIDTIRVHEIKCKYRSYECPVCYNRSGDVDALLDHLQNIHTQERIYLKNEIDLDLEVTSINQPQYILASQEIFKFRVNKDTSYYSNNHFTITISSLGGPSFVDLWNYQVIKTIEYVPVQLRKHPNNEFSITYGDNYTTYQQKSSKYKLRILLK